METVTRSCFSVSYTHLEDYLQFVQQIGSREAITRRFFLIFECEPWSNTKRSDEEGEAINAPVSYTHLDVYKRQVLLVPHPLSSAGAVHAGYPSEAALDFLYTAGPWQCSQI